MEKHLSVVGHDIRPTHIEYSAYCSSPQIQRATLGFLRVIEEERKETLALSKRINDDIAKSTALILKTVLKRNRLNRTAAIFILILNLRSITSGLWSF